MEISLSVSFLNFLIKESESFDCSSWEQSKLWSVTSPETKAAFAAAVALVAVAGVLEVGGMPGWRATTGDADSMRTRFAEDGLLGLDAVEGMVVGIGDVYQSAYKKIDNFPN